MTFNSASGIRRLVVAIDGPAGAGKSTVAAHLARTFGLLNLETGAMYRALALKSLQNGVPVDDPAAVLKLTTSTHITLEPHSDGNRVVLDGVDVTGAIRTSEVTSAASHVSVHAAVREWIVSAQRSLGHTASRGVVMEGRDIGTVVFPDAEVKIFLDASPDARGDRRFSQQSDAAASRETILHEMRDRDTRDRSREQSPLIAAKDAIFIDTTSLSLDDVLELTERIVGEHTERI